MKAVKCPNCGSEKCKEITEEKWACLACDNVFLVHNLSKEFRQTDDHIAEVHQDLKQQIESIRDIAKQDEENGDIEFIIDADREIVEGDFLEAYQMYKKYAALHPESYVGYEGMFRALTDNYQDDAGKIFGHDEDSNDWKGVIAPAHNGFDVLQKALQCEDCDKKDLLEKVLRYFQRGAASMYASRLDLSDGGNLQSLLRSSIDEYKEDNKRNEEIIGETKSRVAEYNSMSVIEKMVFLLKFFKSSIIKRAIVLFILGLIGVPELITSVILIYDVVTIINKCRKQIPRDTTLDNAAAISKNNDAIRNCEIVLAEIQALDRMTIEDMEQRILGWRNVNGRILSSEDMYQAFKINAEEERARRAEIEEGYFQVTLRGWGYDPDAVRDILFKYARNTSVLNDRYENRTSFTAGSFRKSEAYALQDMLIQAGGTAYVDRM